MKGIAVLLACAGALAGCATAKNTEVGRAGDAGEIYLALDHTPLKLPLRERGGVKGRIGNLPSVRKTVQPRVMTLVRVTDDAGRNVVKLVLPVFSGDVVLEAIKEQLQRAGHKVLVVEDVPKSAVRGLQLAVTAADFERHTGLFIVDGRGDMRIKVHSYRNGSEIFSREYETAISDYSFGDQSKFPLELMRKGARDLAGQVVPEILQESKQGS